MKISERIKYLREENGMSQAELAKEMKVARMTINNYENGKRSPDIDFTLKLADYFFVTVDYLIGKSEFKKQDDKEYTSEQVQLLMDVCSNLPQPELQGFLKELRRLFDKIGDEGILADNAGKEILSVMYNCVCGTKRLLSHYQTEYANIHDKILYLKENTNLTDEHIKTIANANIPNIYEEAYKIMNTYHETTQIAVKNMQKYMSKHIDDLFSLYDE